MTDGDKDPAHVCLAADLPEAGIHYEKRFSGPVVRGFDDPEIERRGTSGNDRFKDGFFHGVPAG